MNLETSYDSGNEIYFKVKIKELLKVIQILSLLNTIWTMHSP